MNKAIFGRATLIGFALTSNLAIAASTFAAQAAPQISKFSPVEGTAGTSVAIEGSGLTGVTSVQFNGAEASFNILADIVTAIVPTNATTGPITVKTSAGTATSTNVFRVTVMLPPTITGFTPIDGEAGTSVEIRGSNLASATAVKFNGTDATFSVLAGLLFATVPPTATSGPISVTTPSGTTVSSAAFTVTRRGAPAITGFSPTSGPVGASVEIQGTNLVNVTAVQFNGVNAAFLSFSGALRATVPQGASSGQITVTTATGSAKSSGSFTITAGPPPTISDFTPLKGEVGTTVEIHGAFLRDIVSVKFNGAEARFTNSLFQPLTAIVPTNASTGPITVTTRSGTAASADVFTVVNPLAPAISALVPMSGHPGDLIQIHGTNLINVMSVEFQGIAAVFNEFTSERLFVFVPPNGVSGPIKVTTRSGSVVSQDAFTVVGGPVTETPLLAIQALSPKQIELSWKITAGFRLETAGSLTPPVQWSASTLTAVETQGRSVVAITPDGSTRFYRLNKP